MIPTPPHIITEDDHDYPLGALKGNVVHYDFQQILSYLQFKGKKCFGKRFSICEKDHGVLKKLIYCVIKDYENCEKLQIDPAKGILLTGPIGCGKTSLMKLLKFIVPHQKPYSVIPSRNILFSFNHIGFKAVEDYGNSSYFCFDDLGVEPMGRYYGQDCNVMGEVLLSRYELFVNHKVKTHATTNLNADELEGRYGNRVRSRMRQLFNLIAFDQATSDKRI